MGSFKPVLAAGMPHADVEWDLAYRTAICTRIETAGGFGKADISRIMRRLKCAA
jgi:hypothetical protein